MAYELTETEKRLGAIPGQLSEGDRAVVGAESAVRAIGADRPAYAPQFGPSGVVTQTPKYQQDLADRKQQAVTGKFSVPSDTRVQSAPTAEFKLPGGTSGGGNDKPFSFIEQLQRMQAIDPGKYGTGQPRTGYFDNPAMNEDQRWSSSDINMRQQAYNDAEAGRAMNLESLKQRGEMSRLGVEFGYRGAEGEKDRAAKRAAIGEEFGYRGAEAEKERGELAPYREAQIKGLQGQTALAGAQLGEVKSRARAAKQREAALTILRGEPGEYTDARIKSAKAYMDYTNPKSLQERELDWKIAGEPVVTKAEGGVVRGYADGGAVGRDIAQPAPQVNPLIAQYGQYLTAAASAGVPPVPFAKYQDLLQTTRSSMQETPPVGFADGGDVSELGRPLEGPGTGTSDSIPAVIDGKTPAALSTDEFVMPADVTKYYGTKFMNDLIAKAKAALGGGEGATANG